MDKDADTCLYVSFLVPHSLFANYFYAHLTLQASRRILKNKKGFVAYQPFFLIFFVIYFLVSIYSHSFMIYTHSPGETRNGRWTAEPN